MGSYYFEKRGIERLDQTESLKNAGYDATTEIKRLEYVYQNAFSGGEQ